MAYNNRCMTLSLALSALVAGCSGTPGIVADASEGLTPRLDLQLPSGSCTSGNGWGQFSKVLPCSNVRLINASGNGDISGALNELVEEWNATGLPAAGLFDLVTSGSAADTVVFVLAAQHDPGGTAWCGSTKPARDTIAVWMDPSGSPTCDGAAPLGAIVVHEFTHVIGTVGNGHISPTYGTSASILHCANAIPSGPVSGTFCAWEIYAFAYVYGVSTWSPPIADIAKHVLTHVRLRDAAGNPIDTLKLIAGQDSTVSLRLYLERSGGYDTGDGQAPNGSDDVSWGASGAGLSLSGNSSTGVTITAGSSAGTGVVWVRLNSLYSDRFVVPPIVDSIEVPVIVLKPTLGLSPGSNRDTVSVGSASPGGDAAVTFTGSGGSLVAWTASKSASWVTLGTASGVGAGEVTWSRTTPSTPGTYSGTITVTAPGSASSPQVFYDTLVVVPASEVTPINFELGSGCSQSAGAPPWHQHKQYAQYQVVWGVQGTPASTDSFRIYEGGGSSPWSTASVIRKGRVDAYSGQIGEWAEDTYLVQGTDWRHFWLTFFNANGETDTLRILGDSVLVSAGCPDP